MDQLFVLVPLCVGLVCVVVIGVIVFVIVRGVAQWQYNNMQPVRSVEARVVAKRTEVDGRTGGNTWTYCYCTFELPDGERREFAQSGAEYGQLAEGDGGTLTYQGTRYRGFRRHGH
jgi:hypothetical protein